MSLLLLFIPDVPGVAPLIGCDLAQEDGDGLLLEDGGAIVLDGYTCDVVPPIIGRGRQAFRVMPDELPWLEDDDWLLVEVA